ncbi:hypothetical protein PCASD_14286 [Puccinia coronata f. sp. avenae]|uniref:JmjC domain-containing protein n=1 Tax=Puccinia coronata f. sp. avenae TaxID=200324 RepID=A0A2N5TF06_9BASI|nr:hypothetical protein PCASD_14286 [Puccinia coronata f. sp. avenae]
MSSPLSSPPPPTYTHQHQHQHQHHQHQHHQHHHHQHQHHHHHHQQHHHHHHHHEQKISTTPPSEPLSEQNHHHHHHHSDSELTDNDNSDSGSTQGTFLVNDQKPITTPQEDPVLSLESSSQTHVTPDLVDTLSEKVPLQNETADPTPFPTRRTPTTIKFKLKNNNPIIPINPFIQPKKRTIDSLEIHQLKPRKVKPKKRPTPSNPQPKPSPPVQKLVYFNHTNQVLPTYEEICKSHGSLPSNLTFELQTCGCNSLPDLLRRYRCAPCIAKQGGYICAFRWIRSWICKQNPPGEIVGAPVFLDSTTHPLQLSYQSPDFPTEFNRLPALQDLTELRTLLAKILLPAIERELDWLQDPQVKFIGRRIEVATKCDYCSATLIGAAWLCSQCGAEACTKCFELLVKRTRLGSKMPKKSPPLRNINEGWLIRLTTCTKWHATHTPASHVKISHITREELVTLRNEMYPLTSAELDEPLPTSTSPIEEPDPYSVPTHLLQYLYHPENSQPYIKIDVNQLEANPSIFHRLWSEGQVIVVTGMKDRLHINWTPDYFMSRHADDKCQQIESNSPKQISVDTTVGAFFRKFQQEPSESQEVLKLRDWPPEADFRHKFPALFNDFENAIPISDITTRFGIRNVAAHFPTNANVPDIGPKMYIAMKNSDQVGSRGSTVLHMDVADAINIQTYAKEGDGEGCALWHLYHAKDSQTLREFLYQYQADELGMSVEDVKSQLDDPIHTTRIYVDADMRKTLREKYGVVGWEVRQKPGDAVFIPAYTAHQVCNLANCIKVAADFVSPHSIQRCIKLTEEYRVQNHEHRKPWREDLLQINQMLLYAFLSTGRSIQEFQKKHPDPFLAAG